MKVTDNSVSERIDNNLECHGITKDWVTMYIWEKKNSSGSSS